MAPSPAALVALLVASCAAVAAATTFDVGDGHGWETGVDYAAWTSDKTFAVGDTLGEKDHLGYRNTVLLLALGPCWENC